MPLIWDMLGFAGKAVIVFLTFAASISFLFARVFARQRSEPHITLREVSERWVRDAAALKAALSHATKRRWSRAQRAASNRDVHARRVFVIDFKGDVLATEVESLREEVTAILGVAESTDEVVVRLESSGGAVHGYGLAASQLARIRSRAIPLTVCIDKIAASGGYMMACVAQRIAAAPFAILGSIGVVAPVPNLHRLLQRHGVDYEDITAGQFKRPVSLLGHITEEGREKLKEQIEETHDLFKRYVNEMRPTLDIEAVATGEHWYGTRALELGLADTLTTSDDYLLEKAKVARVFEVVCERPRSIRERAIAIAQASVAMFEQLRSR